MVPRVGLQPYLGLVRGPTTPYVEYLGVLGFVVSERPHWDHVEYWFVVNGRHDSYGETYVCNGHNCHKWCTDG